METGVFVVAYNHLPLRCASLSHCSTLSCPLFSLSLFLRIAGTFEQREIKSIQCTKGREGKGREGKGRSRSSAEPRCQERSPWWETQVSDFGVTSKASSFKVLPLIWADMKIGLSEWPGPAGETRKRALTLCMWVCVYACMFVVCVLLHTVLHAFLFCCCSRSCSFVGLNTYGGILWKGGFFSGWAWLYGKWVCVRFLFCFKPAYHLEEQWEKLQTHHCILHKPHKDTGGCKQQPVFYGKSISIK